MTATKPLTGVAAAALGVVFATGLALAQPPGPQPGRMGQMKMPRYDKATETTLHGTVSRVEEAVPKNCPNCATGVHLWLDSDGKSYEVHLGPSSFVKAKEWSFAKGDVLDVTGSQVSVDDQSFLLAREVKKGDNTLMLRDENGFPAWSRRKPS